jgi:hypothetical protein
MCRVGFVYRPPPTPTPERTMRLRKITFVLLALCACPAVSFAGPIEFQLYPTNLQVEPGNPAIGASLYLLPPGGPYAVDPATGTAPTVPLVGYDPTRLPQPAPIDVHPNGTAHWNNDGYFTVGYRITDVASGQFADFTAGGRAHQYNFYSDGQWTGETVFWFGGLDRVTLGGNDYTIWGPGAEGKYAADLPALSVWVGPNPPAHLTPEPATLALAALGLAPFAFRRLRKK